MTHKEFKLTVKKEIIENADFINEKEVLPAFVFVSRSRSG